MSNARMRQYLSHDDFINPCQHHNLDVSTTSSLTVCNSAPSRLERLSDLFDDGYFPYKLRTKSPSLSSIFQKISSCREPILGQNYSSEFLFGKQGQMPVPSNSPAKIEESTLEAGLEVTKTQNGFLSHICHDTNNNERSGSIDDFETISQTSSTSLESGDAHRSFYGTIATPSVSYSNNDWQNIIKKDALNLVPQLLVTESFFEYSDVISTDVSKGAISVLDCKNISSSLVEDIPSSSGINQKDCNDDQESISSFSSEDTFVCDDILEERPIAMYRSLSDSTVHRSSKEKKDCKVKRRKSVHFADTEGYELETRITFHQTDDYFVPPRLMEALGKIRMEADVTHDDSFILKDMTYHTNLLPQYSLVPTFQQPFMEVTFRNRVDQQKVCLESVSVLPNSLSLTGVIRVTNLEFEKQVCVRYTIDNWRTFIDIPAYYVSSLRDFQQDQFSFHLVASNTILNQGNIEMAIRYRLPTSKRVFWDNNYGRNYVIKCLEYLGSA